eukprot:CAMPEP_0182443964 /NCGR_PEP_ID=MMETSP1172-20130603/2568_1 /TAXON_ID=708627 /ORGANISM="Timspurckia oligopyrenoides, Strain CCMP3278" /LENGTH=938 /DNA_ID=CAMNT_0024639405 /DNA_START=223 /DNA_END=3039 /DNA_ORIENTATION=+
MSTIKSHGYENSTGKGFSDVGTRFSESTLKQQEREIERLTKTNFDLQLKLFHAEERLSTARTSPNAAKSQNSESMVAQARLLENTKRELDQKIELLAKARTAIYKLNDALEAAEKQKDALRKSLETKRVVEYRPEVIESEYGSTSGEIISKCREYAEKLEEAVKALDNAKNGEDLLKIEKNQLELELNELKQQSLESESVSIELQKQLDDARMHLEDASHAQGELEERAKEIEALKEAWEAEQARVLELNKKIEALEIREREMEAAKANALEALRGELEVECGELIEELDQLKEQLESTKDILVEKDEAIKEWRLRAENFERKLQLSGESENERIAALEADARNAEKHSAELKMQFDTEAKSLYEQLNNARQESSKNLETASKANELLEKSKSEAEIASTERDNLRVQLEELLVEHQEKSSALSDEICELQEKLTEEMIEKEAAVEVRQKLEVKVNVLREQLEENEAELCRIRESLDDLQNSKTSQCLVLELEVSSLRSQLEKGLYKLVAEKCANVAARREIERGYDSVNAQKLKENENSLQIQFLRNEIEQLESTLEIRDHENIRLQSEINENRSEMTSKTVHSEEIVAALTRERDEAVIQLNTVSQSELLLKDRVRVLSGELSKLESDHQSKITESSCGLEQLNEKIRVLQNECDELREKAETTATERDALCEKLEAVESELKGHKGAYIRIQEHLNVTVAEAEARHDGQVLKLNEMTKQLGVERKCKIELEELVCAVEKKKREFDDDVQKRHRIEVHELIKKHREEVAEKENQREMDIGELCECVKVLENRLVEQEKKSEQDRDGYEMKVAELKEDMKVVESERDVVVGRNAELEKRVKELEMALLEEQRDQTSPSFAEFASGGKSGSSSGWRSIVVRQLAESERVLFEAQRELRAEKRKLCRKTVEHNTSSAETPKPMIDSKKSQNQRLPLTQL